ncbi:MAG: hypothetical protein JXB05_04790 [Myxococcaceae bacterium]|nr:hypothetical protein [Myxococcaceae bacterium]
MKLLSPSAAALAFSLLAAPPALAMDQRQANAHCAAGKLECPAGAPATLAPGKKAGALECKAKGRQVKEGPAVLCKEGKAQAWGDWKAGKKHGRHITLRPDGSWMEEDFAGGKQEGRSVKYGAEGQLLGETYFHGGKKHGAERTYKEDGRLASETYWDKGVRGKKPAVAAQKPPESAKPLQSAEGPASESAAPGEQAQAPAEAGKPAPEAAPAPASEDAKANEAQATTPEP